MSTILDRIRAGQDEARLIKAGWPVPEVGTERMVLSLICRGLPPPVLQHRAGSYRIDAAWPKAWVALEVDGWHHDRPETAARDWARHRWLTKKGWIVLHLDPYADAFPEHLLRLIRVLQAMLG